MPETPLISLEEIEEDTFRCPHCDAEHSSEIDADECCGYACPRCGDRYSDPYSADECCPVYHCPNCGSEWDSHEEAEECCRQGGSRSYPALTELQSVYRLGVPELPNRPARLCSIEQEVVDGGAAAAQMLYDFGFAATSDFGSYSSSPRRGMVGVVADGSLPSEGGEIIYSRFLLSEEADVEVISRAAARMRQLAREANIVRVGKAAGTHIHISATAEDGTRIGPSQMAALHEIFSYAEDFLYSIAAAGWDTHRSPVGRNGGYCMPIPKLADGERRSGFAVHRLMAANRYFGLNFQRLLNAASNCSCGAARFGEWDACECGTFDGATVEWRLFNASTKPETLHAWLILSHALTALAMTHPVGTLPTNGYGLTDANSRKAVQQWIEQNAPLTDDEVQVIRNAVRRSPRMR